MGIRPSEVDDVYPLPDLPVGPPFHFTEPRSFFTVGRGLSPQENGRGRV
jgi:hypothetical protein